MKIKFFPAFLIIFFIIIFFIFYKGLQNSNIYTPNISIKKNIPSFQAKIFDTNDKISSEEIFKLNKYFLLINTLTGIYSYKKVSIMNL